MALGGHDDLWQLAALHDISKRRQFEAISKVDLSLIHPFAVSVHVRHNFP
jgi:hypothetical protein